MLGINVLNRHRVLMIMPKISRGSFDFGIPNEPPVGLAYLAAILKENSVNFKVIDMRLGYTSREIKNTIENYKPTLIGISYWSLERRKTQKLIKQIKQNTDTPIVLGGPHVSSVGKQCLIETEAQYAIKGEGEFALVELLECLSGNHRSFDQIEGLIYRENETIAENSNRIPNKHLDSLPFPAYEDLEINKYKRKTKINIATSRGCPYGCNYCAVKLTMGRNFRPRSPHNVVNELIYWNRMGYDEFEFIDDCFTFDMRRAEDICDLIIRNNLKIEWYLNNGIRADRVNEELLSKMKRAGCKIVNFGVESGNNETLARIGKNIEVEQAEKAIRTAQKVGIETVGATFIIGHPGETLKTFQDYLEKIEAWPMDKVNFYNLVPYPGTEVYSWMQDNAKLLDKRDKFLDKISYYSKNPIFETTAFPKRDRKKAFRLGKKLHNRVSTRYFTKKFSKRYGPIIGFFGGRIVNFGRLMVFLSSLGINSFIKKTFLRRNQ